MKTNLVTSIFLISFSCFSYAAATSTATPPTPAKPAAANSAQPTTATTETNVLPNCSNQNIKYQEGSVLLQTESSQKPRIYFLHNTSKYIITVDHAKSNPGASAGWASQMHPNRWSVIVVSQPNFALKCGRATLKGGFKNIPCQELIRICSYDNYIDKENITAAGDFWLSEDMVYEDMMKKLQTRQISLPKP